MWGGDSLPSVCSVAVCHFTYCHSHIEIKARRFERRRSTFREGRGQRVHRQGRCFFPRFKQSPQNRSHSGTYTESPERSILPALCRPPSDRSLAFSAFSGGAQMRAHLDLVRGCPGARCAAAAQQCSAVPIVPAVMSRADFALLKQNAAYSTAAGGFREPTFITGQRQKEIMCKEGDGGKRV